MVQLDALEDVFLDAHVIDLDFSKWDQAVRMVVVGIDSATDGDRLPVFVVEFQGVYTFQASFSHHGIVPQVGEHVQWRCHNLTVDPTDRGWRLTLSGSRQFPTTTIECQDVVIRMIAHADLDRRFPGWERPGGPFVRHGVEELLT